MRKEEEAIKVVDLLQNSGHQAVFAGGCVRDKLLGQDPNDIDIATSAEPSEVEEIFQGFNQVSIGKAFGVIQVKIEQHEFEIATFRKDIGGLDGRHPEKVEFSSMEEDANRRDFTINGMFFDPIVNKLYDFVEGKKDLQRRLVKFIGEPRDRIIEDKLRILRFYRFYNKLNFFPDSRSLLACLDLGHEITSVSVERITDEITKGLMQAKSRGKYFLDILPIITNIIPEISKMDRCLQPPEFHPEGDVLEHTMYALDELPHYSSPELIWATVLHDIGKPPTRVVDETGRARFNQHELVGKDIAREILTRLKFSNSSMEHILSLIGNHMKFMHVHNMKKSTLKRFLSTPGFSDHLELHYADCKSSHEDLRNYTFCMNKISEFKDLDQTPEVKLEPRFITGDDLISWGYKPGPEFKTILEYIEDSLIDQTLEKNKDLIKEHILGNFKCA